MRILASAVLLGSLLTVAGTTARSADTTSGQSVPPPLIVEVTAERFTFTPSEIKVPPGTTLDIRLRSDDTAHGFRIVGTDVNLVIPKRGRGVATVTFRPPAPGRYEFECAKLCGAGHSFMRGVILVADAAREPGR